ncbi:uclacyanin-2 [Nicotiana attenuata]|uniref:Uclacyanin-2 n=1 Tax=Nicotiana attenuata TaxID=49451 RepID=A0A314L6F0_NICAT|nr:uclacyanin-2 [Nicotiana attenuata]
MLVGQSLASTEYPLEWGFGFDYNAWANGKEFKVDDTLGKFYGSDANLHDVVETNYDGYSSCSLTPNNILRPSWTVDANGQAKYTFSNPGLVYLTSSMLGDCASNLKLAANVQS